MAMDGSNFEIPDEGTKSVFDELKTHLAQRRRTLRSKTPDGMRQEFFGSVLAHYAVCWLMHPMASEHKLAQRRLSFTGHVQLMRRSQPRSSALFRRAPAEAPGCANAGSRICCRGATTLHQQKRPLQPKNGQAAAFALCQP